MDDDDDNDGMIRYMKQFETAKTAVFWDKQACGTPGLNTLQVAQNIRSALEELNYSGPASIFAYCDTEQTWDDLQSPTIVKHHEPTDEKDRVGRGRIGGFLRRCRRAVSLFADQSENSSAIVINHIDTEADRIDLIFADMLIWAMNNPAPANVMLVVGDISRMAFIKSFHRLRSANYNVLLAQPSKASAPRALPIDAKLVWERLSAGEVFIVQIDRSKPLNRSRPLDTGSILLAGAWIVLTYFLKRRSQ